MMTSRTRRRIRRFFRRNRPWIFLASVLLMLAVVAVLGCAPRREVPMPKSQETIPRPRHDDFVAQLSGEKEIFGNELELPPRTHEHGLRRAPIPDADNPAVPLDYWRRCEFSAIPENGLSILNCFYPSGQKFRYGPIAGHQGPARRTARALFLRRF
ncbi:MAG: hypothetical protein HYT39_03420 [Candidatus Sungbacteria bacterium]|nr:hypothetical protein [Candidatus Sungbacteria bacterium]